MMHVGFAASRDSWALCVLVVAVMMLAGCASGDLEEVPLECESHADCDPDALCDFQTNRCTTGPQPGDDTGPGLDSSQNNMDGTDEPDLGEPDLPIIDPPDMSIDQGDVTCSPECASNQTCSPDGTCVDLCMPACEAPEVCTAQGCRIPDCAAEDEICDLNRRIQGDFACLSRDGEGRCFKTCDDAFSPSDCGTARYCLNVSSGATPLNVCIDSECTTEADCGQDSCIPFDNDFGSCARAGQIAEGESCSVPTNMCEQGTICRRLASGNDSGVCSRICDFFATTSDCPAGQACGSLLSPRAGLCTTETTGPGTTAYDACSDPGQFCGDGLRCLGTSGGGDFCFPYCRPGDGDCDAILPDGSDGACANDFFPGISALGVCNPPCDPGETNACGVGAVCLDNGFGDNICRRTCSAGNEVEDCCNGSSPCGFECNADNLCE